MTLRIALVTEQFPPWGSGVAVSAKRLADSLYRANHHIVVYSYDLDAPLNSVPTRRCLTENPYPVWLIGPYHKGRGVEFSDGQKAIFRRNFTAQLLICLQDDPPDIIHGFFLLDAGFLAQVAGLERRVPCVQSCRGNDIGKNLFNLNKLAATQWVFEHARWVTFVNKHLAERARRFYPSVASRSSVIYNSIDPDSLPDSSLVIDLPQGPLIGYIGGLREKKGISQLIMATADLDAHLVLVGKSSRESDQALLAATLARAGNVEQVLLVGARPRHELASLLDRFDVFVQPSLDDGHPNSLLEAMARGRPIVATTIFRDVLEDGVEALLVPPGDVASLQAAIRQLLEDPQQARTLGEAARAAAEARFTPQRELEGYLEVYGKVLVR